MTHVIAIDGSDSSQEAFEYAANTLRPSDKFVILNVRQEGIFASIKSPQDTPDQDMLVDKYERQCHQYNVNHSALVYKADFH